MTENRIDYTEIDKLKRALVGRSIVSRIGAGGDYPAVIKYVLDDGSILNAHATHGGCACSNGCFNVRPDEDVKGTILNVEVREVATTYEWGKGYTEREVDPGSVFDGSATISIFVYSELGEQRLLTSEGGDNGYYGWGFWLHIDQPESETGGSA